MKTFLRKKTAILLMALFSSAFVFQSCEKILDDIISILETGWLMDDEDMDNIPEDITPFEDEDDPVVVETKISLEHLFPPIGDQGQYGTCVAWSVGYNLKTALNAIEKGWKTGDLSKTDNQTSPKDLWMAIPSSKKGANCNGTNFEPALDALISSGAASLNSVPYTGLGNCTGTPKGDDKNKLANYRKIASEKEGLTVANFKGYLNAGRPIAIGAKLGDRFMKWDNASILSNDTYNNPGMQHAYHAMVLVGYDDDKQAFRVRNSWGKDSWGDDGSIWVDYNFFCKSFCFAAFVAQNVNNVGFGSGGGIIEGDLTSGYDLLAYDAWDIVDPEKGGRNRVFSYDVYNSGTKPILPSQNWTVAYLYYNAVNANDYQIIFEDYYTTEFGPGDGYYDESVGLAGGWWNNYPVASGKKAGEAEYPDGFVITYTMPSITGKYYLVVMADAYDVIREANEDNNFFFITADNGKPLDFVNGEISKPPTKSGKIPTPPALFSNTENQTPVKPGNLNAYTPAEIRAMLLRDKKSGKLDLKMNAARLGGKAGTKVKR
ncbi:MAG: C1 family peptidase [Bacteroidales bacterium]|nr:C1 family peptidase [Bacteroidales bacterium]